MGRPRRHFAEAGEALRPDELLLQRAIPIYLEAGYTDEALADYRSDLEDSIGRVVNGTGRASDGAAYSFQDCSALIGQ